MSTFSMLGVLPELVAGLDEQGITKPFPIQEATIPDALAGRDICGRAPTGSGKTLAFSIPMVSGIERGRPRHPRGLVLVPTRELAAQVTAVLEPLAATRGLRVTSIYGGVGFEPQLKVIRRGVDIVVACPGRLNDLVDRGALSLNDVDFVVIDEADRMADMGFLPDVRRLLDQTDKDRQTLLFSATLDGDVDTLIRRYQHDPMRHEVVVDEDEEDNSLHLFWSAPRGERLSLCREILMQSGPTMVFTRTKHGADRLSEQLGRQGVKSVAIHGGRSQPQRDRALAEFISGSVDVLIATDVAARGIHVDGVSTVIHFDVPEDYKAYVHRSGRTARAGATGTIISLVEPEKMRDVHQMQRQLQMAAGVIAPNFKALPEAPAPRPVVALPESSQSGAAAQAGSSAGRRGGRPRRRSSGASGSGASGSGGSTPAAANGTGRPGRSRNRRRRPAA